jgi:hypothetical protein
MIDKTNLVYVKGGGPLEYADGYSFEANKHYRSMQQKDGTWIVNGYEFDDVTFRDCFKFAHERIMYHLSDGFLNPNDKPLSKKEFAEKLDIHQYGRGKNRLFILLLRNSIGVMYGFYPYTDTKPKMIAQAYKWYTEIIEGNLNSIDDGDVQFGNKGIPIVYGDLGVW